MTKKTYETNGAHVKRAYDKNALENGFSKLPMATVEQLGLLNVSNKEYNDEKQRQHVLQLQEMTQCTEERAFFALHDAAGDMNRAAELLLENRVDEWFSTNKKIKVKATVSSNVGRKSEETETRLSINDREKRKEKVENNDREITISKRSISPNNTSVNHNYKSHTIENNLDIKKRTPIRNNAFQQKETSLGDENDIRNKSSRSDRTKNNRVNRRVMPVTTSPSLHEDRENEEGWDPTAEYEWTGEAIEIVNSNASLALNLNENVTEAPVAVESVLVENAEAEKCSHSNTSSKCVPTLSHPIFTKKASTLPPMPAFNNLPFTPVFLAHRPNCEASYKTALKFHEAVIPTPVPVVSTVPVQKPIANFTQPSTTNNDLTRTNPINQPENQHISTSNDLSSDSRPLQSESDSNSHKVRGPTLNSFDMNTPVALTSLLEAAVAKDVSKPEATSNGEGTFRSGQFPHMKTNAAPVSVSNVYTGGPSATQFVAQNPNVDQNSTPVSHYPLKQYVLNNLTDNMANLGVSEETPSNKPANEFQQQTSGSVPMAQQGSTIVLQSSQNDVMSAGIFANKPVSMSASQPQQHQSNIPSLTQQPQPVQQVAAAQLSKSPMQQQNSGALNQISTTQSSLSGSHHQQPPTLPPNLAPMLSQFPTGYPMFNLSTAAGNNAPTGAGPALVDLEQFNLMHQHRLFFELQQSHQSQQHQQVSAPQSHVGVTTSSNLLSNPNSDPAASIAKVLSQSGQAGPPLGHVSAAGNSTGLRPDMMPQIGHAPPVIAPGPPYFTYPMVFMNSYPNYVSQQQQGGGGGQQGGQGANTGSPLTSGVGGQQGGGNSQQQQPFGAMKNNATGTGGGYQTPGSFPGSGNSGGNANSHGNGYEDLVDMKYVNANKQVGFKNNGAGQPTGGFGGQHMQSGNDGGKPSGNVSQASPATTGVGPTNFPTAQQFGAAAAAAAAVANNHMYQMYSGGPTGAAGGHHGGGGGLGGGAGGGGNANSMGANAGGVQNRPNSNASQVNAMMAAALQQQHHPSQVAMPTLC